jgi:hypothetical protein
MRVRRKEWSMVKAAGIILLAVVAAAVVVVLVYALGAPLSVVLALTFGAIGLGWLLVLLTVPWNLYFQARNVRRDIRQSREREIEVAAAREEEVRRIARRTAWIAVGGHVASAAAVAVVTYVSGAQVGYYFAGFYLLSTLFRPAAAYLSGLRERLSALGHEVRYPREDVATMRTTVTELATRVETLENRISELAGKHQHLARQLDRDNQEVTRGLRSLMRMMGE